MCLRWLKGPDQHKYLQPNLLSMNMQWLLGILVTDLEPWTKLCLDVPCQQTASTSWLYEPPPSLGAKIISDSIRDVTFTRVVRDFMKRCDRVLKKPLDNVDQVGGDIRYLIHVILDAGFFLKIFTVCQLYTVYLLACEKQCDPYCTARGLHRRPNRKRTSRGESSDQRSRLKLFIKVLGELKERGDNCGSTKFWQAI